MATLLERVRGAAEGTRELERPLKEAILERDAAILAGLSRQRVHEIVKTRSG